MHTTNGKWFIFNPIILLNSIYLFIAKDEEGTDRETDSTIKQDDLMLELVSMPPLLFIARNDQPHPDRVFILL